MDQFHTVEVDQFYGVVDSALKFAADRDKDLDDVRQLLRHLAPDMAALRSLIRHHMGSLVAARFETFLGRIGHPAARRYEEDEGER